MCEKDTSEDFVWIENGVDAEVHEDGVHMEATLFADVHARKVKGISSTRAILF